MKAYVRDNISVIFLLVILFIIIGMTVFVAISLKSDPVAENLKNDEVVKVLIVLNDGAGNALATDVLVYYPPSQKGMLFNILGNTGGLYRSLNRTDRIDAIYREKGIRVYNEEISRVTGLSTPFTIEISLDNLALLTDLLGGMKVFVPSPVDAVDEVSGVRWLLPSGAVTLDGDKIQTYMLYHIADETDSNIDERRQNTLIALLQAMHTNSSLILDSRNFPTFSVLMKANVDYSSLRNLLSYIINMDTENLVPRTIAGSLRELNGQRLLFPYEDTDGLQFRLVVKQALNSLVREGNESRVYVVEVQNGTKRPNLARNAADLLQNFGYDVLQAVNAGEDYEHTVIISHIGNTEALQALCDTIDCRYTIEEDVRPASAGMDAGNKDFTLILGDDWNGRRVRGGYTGPTEAE